MLFRAQALALFVLMALAASLQGTAFLQCLCSGRIVIAAFGKTECHSQSTGSDEGARCSDCTGEVASDTACRRVDCWRVVDFGDGQPQQAGSVIEAPIHAPSILRECVSSIVPPRDSTLRALILHRPPDPPSPSLTILYASLLL